MNSQLSRLYYRVYCVAVRNFYPQIVKRDYCRWISRRPSKVIYPSASVKTENVIDLTEHYTEKMFVDDTTPEEEHADSQVGEGAFPIKKLKTKKDSKPKKDMPANSENVKKELFDLDVIDAQTHGVNVKKVIREKTKSESKSLKFADRKQKLNLKAEPIAAINVFDSKGNFVYEKLPYKDTTVGNRIINLKSRKDRVRMGQFLVEGWRLIMDGLQAGCELDTLIFSQLEDLERLRPFMPNKGVKLYKMPYNEMKMWSNLDTCPGFIGIFKMPQTLCGKKEVYRINVICDNLRDPGNVGSLLRTCLGVGCDTVLLTKGCVDIWDGKVLRSACGAHFRLTVKSNIDWDEISQLIDIDSTVLLADNNAKGDLIVSSFKKKTAEEDDSDEEDSDDENDSYSETPTTVKIPLTQYFKLDYAQMKSITLIIGGETEGISQECYRFATERNGTRINIPLQIGVDSLNSSMAFGVIAFEIKKQLMEAGLSPLRITAKG